MSTSRILNLSDSDLSSCVGCGLCLPHCPTFRVTGEEALSPRGRIATIRAIQWEGVELTAESSGFLNTCIQCRACEPACPSGVPYARLLEAAKQEMVQQKRATPRWQQWALKILPHQWLLVLITPFMAILQRLHLAPKRMTISRLGMWPGRRVQATSPTPQIWIFTGCVMNAWQRHTHRSTAALVTAVGLTIGVPNHFGACCGALHSHAGLGEQAHRMAKNVMASMPGLAPIVVDSAGCGAALKEYGLLLGTTEAKIFSQRVFDIHEWLEPHMPVLLKNVATDLLPHKLKIVIQDACHLRHVQKSHQAVRTVLQPIAELLELSDDGMCCGAGGVFSILEPEMALLVRQRKVDHIRAVCGDADPLVASANPGCSMFLGHAGLRVRHPVDILAEHLGLVPVKSRNIP